MFGKNTLFNSVLISVITGILLSQSMSLGADVSGTNLLKLLSEKDQVAKSNSFKVSFFMTKNAKVFHPEQGIVVMNCNATWTPDGSLAMKTVYNYEKEIPIFAPPESGLYKSFDYDSDGNLIVWRSLEKYIFFAPERNETIEKIKSFFVDPNGRLVDKGGSQTLLHRFPIGNRDHMYEFNQFQLATGRGFSKHLGTAMSVKSLALGLTKVNSKGSYGPGLQGTWELTVDPNSDHLVKEAIFTMDGADKPTIAVTSTGVMMKDGIKIAKYGTFKYSNFLEVSVEVTNVSKAVGPNTLYEEVLSRLNSPLPSGAEIIDFRGEKPVSTTVE